MKGIIFVVVFIVLVCGVAGRVRRDEATLDQILTTNHTEFVKLLNTYNPSLYNEIKSATSTNALTLFVPTDAAIQEALKGKIPNATDTLNYHAHRGDIVNFYLRDFYTLPTLYSSPNLPGPQVLSFSAVNVTSNVTIINYQAQIIGADITASNGMIHVIDQVLNVPYEDVIRAANIGNFEHLQELVTIANFTDPDSTTNVTLLAPTDVAFTALYEQQPILKAYFNQNKLPSVKSTIQNLLTKHLIKGAFYPATLANGTTIFDSVFGTETVKVDKTFNNITVSLAEAKATVAAVTIPNLLAADGVAHGINQVLTVPGQGLLSLSDILNTLNATNYIGRLNATGLINILEDNTPRTYFVPLDNIAGVNNLNASDILYGIAQLPALSFSGRYVDSSLFLPSLGNGSQKLYVETSPINNVTRASKVNGIIATGPAITNKGSYVYSINTLLIVPGIPENVLNAAGDNNFTAFTSLYTEKTLTNTGIYDINNASTTLFVPTNEAFSKLPLGVVGFLRVNDTTAKRYATEILNNHIADHELLYNINQGLTQLVSANAQPLNLNRNSGGITVSGPGYTAAVNPAALLTNNGAAFPIDSVLVPQGVKLTAEEILRGLAFENTTGESLGKYYTSIQNFEQVGLLDLLRSTNEQFTLFVYTDAAWDNAAQSYAGIGNQTEELEQLSNIINYGIVYGESVQDLNKSNVLVPGHHSNSTITVIQAGPDEKTKVSLKTLQGTYEATVVVSTVTGYNQAIYGLDRVLGVDTKDTSKGNKLPTWAWVVIIVGGILIGLLILAVIVGAAWYLFVRPNREGYRHIN